MGRKLLIVDVAALGYEFLRANQVTSIAGLEVSPVRSVFPALTCSVQASFRTASAPARHGMVANGLYFRDLRKVMFWEQSSLLVAGERIWSDFRRSGGKVGMLFWQQSLGEQADVVLSPAPIHLHHGGMVSDCYCRPAGLYDRLCRKVGRKFNLMHYWGPLASSKAGQWIADAASALLREPDAPDLCMVYLPSLDYDLQRYPAGHDKNKRALTKTLAQLDCMVRASREGGYEILMFGDYAIADTSAGNAAVFPNRQLLSDGLLAVRKVGDMLYPDFHASNAFAVVDHEVGYVHVKDAADVPAVQTSLRKLPHVTVVPAGEFAAMGIDHANAGQLAIIAQAGHWLAYPWWIGKRHDPDYASHIDIHKKPGYDPCELFFGWPPMSITQNTARIRGSHGKIASGREVACCSTLPLTPAADLIALAAAVRDWLA
jgi:predicted AlkP superfamily pyrophosphatase or phosphodiesterase